MGGRSADRNALTFDPSRYTEGSFIDTEGKTVKYRAYEGIVYVADPVDVSHQSMNIYVPEAYFNGENIGNYNSETAPVFFPNGVGGYMPAEPAVIDEQKFGGTQEGEITLTTIQAAIAHGYVAAVPGSRGRTTQNEEGNYTGKAPAAIVDLKAAVSYLRYNDDLIPAKL